MWNRRKEEDQQPKSYAPPTPSELAKEGIPMSTLPVRGSEPNLDNRNAVIGKSVIIKGQIFSREDLTIDGEVEGTVELQEHRLTIGPNGTIRATVKSRELVVLGTIHGNVDITDKIDIRKEGKLVGDIKTARIVIEDGAFFKGNIDIVRPEAPPRAAAPRPAAAPAPTQATLVSDPASSQASSQARAAGQGETKR